MGPGISVRRLKDDETLLPEAGSCANYPKRAGNVLPEAEKEEEEELQFPNSIFSIHWNAMRHAPAFEQ
jgi:hypothetical protein